MRILLINTNTKDDILAAPPIGLSYVATAADAAGHEVKVLDLCFRRNILEEIKRSIVAFSPEVVGMSIRNIDNCNMLRPVFYLEQTRKIVDFIRSVTDVPIVLGGSAASLNPQGILEFIRADYIVVSDGEEAFVKLVRALDQGTSPEDIPGVGSIVEGKFHFVFPVLKDFPIVTANLGKWIDMKPYEKIGGSYTIQSKRGCREKCIYCTYPMIQGHEIRMRSPKDVVDEIEEAYHKFHYREFEFVDSVFNNPQEHALEILEEICKRPWEASFSAAGMDPRGLDTPSLDLMWKAGFRSFMLSPESASDKVIRNYGKGFVVDDLARAAEAMNKTRLTPLWYFLVGGPGETNQTLQETLDFILKYLKHDKHPPYHNVHMFMGVRIYPGTGLWKIGMNEGLVNANTDPLQPCWYLSQSLDIDLAIRQMIETAAVCPELYLGFDERYLSMSKIIAFFGELFGLRKPYWRHLWGINRLLIKTGLRFAFQRKNVSSVLREQLEFQGYNGPLLK